MRIVIEMGENRHINSKIESTYEGEEFCVHELLGVLEMVKFDFTMKAINIQKGESTNENP